MLLDVCMPPSFPPPLLPLSSSLLSLLHPPQLLMVPTPFFIGVHSSFLDKIGASSHSEAWMVNLDSRHFEPPSLSDQQSIPEFPYSILQLQADIRKVCVRACVRACVRVCVCDIFI